MPPGLQIAFACSDEHKTLEPEYMLRDVVSKRPHLTCFPRWQLHTPHRGYKSICADFEKSWFWCINSCLVHFQRCKININYRPTPGRIQPRESEKGGNTQAKTFLQKCLVCLVDLSKALLNLSKYRTGFIRNEHLEPYLPETKVCLGEGFCARPVFTDYPVYTLQSQLEFTPFPLLFFGNVLFLSSFVPNSTLILDSQLKFIVIFCLWSNK